jgi:hypothetical protein
VLLQLGDAYKGASDFRLHKEIKIETRTALLHLTLLPHFSDPHSSGTGGIMIDLMYGSGDKPDLGLDSVGEMSFISWFHKMTPKDDDTIRLFDRGDFFSVHGKDASLVAATVYKTQSVLKILGKGKDAIPSCTLNMTAGKNFLREALTSKQLKVEIWGGGTSKKHSWTLEKQVSGRTCWTLWIANADVLRT